MGRSQARAIERVGADSRAPANLDSFLARHDVMGRGWKYLDVQTFKILMAFESSADGVSVVPGSESGGGVCE